MIPRTFPSSMASNGATQMIVYFLPSVAGLTRWVDYIPVKFTTVATPTTENTYNQNGYIPVVSLSSIAGATPFKEYVPVFLDSNAADADVWDVTITGFIPVGTAGIGGAALYMDFAATTTLDPRITFSRTTNATVTGPDGTLQWAPHNLLTFSEQFDNAAWTKFNGAVTANSVISPEGTLTADTYTADGTNSGHITRATVTLVANTTYAFSLYVKPAGNNWGYLQVGGTGAGGYSTFNYNTGTLGSLQTGLVSRSIIPVGNGWYRAAIVLTTGASVGSNYVEFSTSPTDMVGVVATSGGITVWGAQLNIGALQPYYPTTVKNLLGFTQEFDNAAWTKSNSFIQTNQIRNNTGQGAVIGTPGTLPTNWSTFTSLTGVNREIVSVGIENGINYIDVRLSGTPSGSGSLNLFLDGINTAAAQNQQWTASSYVKLIGGSLSGVTTVQQVLIEYNSSSGFLTQGAASFTPASSGDLNALRITYTRTLANASTAFTRFSYQYNLSGAAIDITLRIGLPQLVQGATAGDVVATYGTAAAVGYTAPDGSLTADKLVEDANTAVHFTQSASVTTVTNAPYVFSTYIKAAENGFAFLRSSGTFGASGVSINLATGQVASTHGSPTNLTATSVGNGWWRVAFTAVAASTTAFLEIVNSRDGDYNGRSYAGNSTNGILIWGAQVSDSASLDPYVYQPVAAPASTAYYGPRFDYDPVTLAPRGLLIEEQRTNLLVQSEALDNASWVKTAATINQNSLISPDGTQDADKLVEDATNAGHFVGQSVSATSGVTYTSSIYAKAGERSVLQSSPSASYLSAGFANFDLVSGTVTASSANVTASMQNVGNGWYRCVTTFTATATATGNFAYFIQTSTTALRGAAYQGDGTSGLFLYGAQLEAGAFATSYIPTTTAAATRAADVATMIGANFSSWYRQDEGTLFAEAATLNVPSPGERSVLRINSNVSNNEIRIRYVDGGLRGQIQTASGETFSQGSSAVAGAVYKTVLAYAADNAAYTRDGAAAVTDTTVSLPTGVFQACIGSSVTSGGVFLNGHIRRITYYPRRLSNTELQTITS